MPQSPSDRANVHACAKQLRRNEVTQIVETNAVEAFGVRGPSKGTRDSVRVPRHSGVDRVAEHEGRVGNNESAQVGTLARSVAMLQHELSGLFVESDTPGRMGLGLLLDEAVRP